MSIELIIDTREHELIQRLEKANVIFKVQQLELGDIVFQQQNEPILVIERKTVADLKASICDGRSREQKARLIGCIPRQHIMYIIEGMLDKPLDSKISGLPVSTLIGSIINTQLRDDIKVYKTSSMDETVEFLIKLLDKLQKDGEHYFKADTNNGVSSSEYSSTLKKSKKANMTPETWFICSLSTIPQVTDKISSVIVSKYPTIKDLMSAYEKTPESSREKLLADMTFVLKTGKSRRIGDKISTRIYNFFHGKMDSVHECMTNSDD